MTKPRKTVVITGASRGIGRAVALRFAREGFCVWALARSTQALEELSRETAGSEIRPVTFDATQPDAAAKAAREILSHCAPDVLVNNAGISVSAPLGKTTDDDYDRIMAVNVRAPFVLCRELMPEMAKSGGGRVINVASTAALKGFKYTSAYCASKHALLGLTRALAVEYAQKNVTVNAICPGWTDTDMLARSAENISKATGRTEAEARRLLADMNPMGRLIRPDDVAELCWFLASEAAASVTGANYLMDGGETA